MQATTITVPAYAKVNLTLDVLSRRPDGFHGIATILQNVSLADTVTISVSREAGITLECDDATVPADESNLAYGAASALLDRADSSAGVHLQLEKRIPSKAGLGGGSSDAAATLRALNELLNIQLTNEELLGLAAGIGSDVPFFLV